MMCQEYECVESRREIERHHRDLKRVSDIAHRAARESLEQPTMVASITLALAIRDIVNIVG
jgi:hypothetical protein